MSRRYPDFIIAPHTCLREGEQPKLIRCGNFYEEANKITNKIIQLKQRGIGYGDICVAYIYSICKGTNYLSMLEVERVSPILFISKSSNTKSKFRLDSGTVNIFTIHSIKGLDFKYVFICSINDRLLDSVKESKKLLYVGLTRARDVLKITYSVDNEIVNGLLKARMKNVDESSKTEDMVAVAREGVVGKRSEEGLLTKTKGLFGR